MEKRHGSGEGLLDALIIVMAFVLFFKTADVMAAFAPDMLNGILGADVSYLFGIVAALCVEAAALTLHFSRRARASTKAQIVMWVLLGISGLCQVFDGFMTTDTLAQQSDTLKVIFSWLVPNIPLLFVALLFWIGTLPEVGEPHSFRGLKYMLPSWQKIWEGDDSQELANPTNGKAKKK